MKLKKIIKRLFLKKAVKSEDKSILIIDDSEESREFLSSAVSRKGYRVLTDTNGEIIKENDKSSLPDLIVINAVIKGNKSINLCEKIKTNPQARNIPVLVFSDNHENIKSIEFYDKGIDYFMTMPFSEGELLRQIEGLLSSKRRG